MINTLLFFLIIASAKPLQIYACSCPPLEMTSLEEDMIEATEIFLGTVISATLNPTNNFSEIRYRVEKRWKGSDSNEVTVWSDTNNNCGYYGYVGKRELVIAHERDGKLRISICSIITPEYRSNKYSVTAEEVLDILITLSPEQIKNMNGKIEAKIIRLGDAEIQDISDPKMNWKWSYTIVELNKGKKDGLYRGMEMCLPKHGLIPLTVLDVKEDSSSAVFTDIIGYKDEENINPLGVEVKNTIGECN